MCIKNSNGFFDNEFLKYFVRYFGNSLYFFIILIPLFLNFHFHDLIESGRILSNYFINCSLLFIRRDDTSIFDIKPCKYFLHSTCAINIILWLRIKLLSLSDNFGVECFNGSISKHVTVGSFHIERLIKSINQQFKIMFKRLILFNGPVRFLLVEFMHRSHHLHKIKTYMKVLVIIINIILLYNLHIIFKILIHR